MICVCCLSFEMCTDSGLWAGSMVSACFSPTGHPPNSLSTWSFKLGQSILPATDTMVPFGRKYRSWNARSFLTVSPSSVSSVP